LVVEESTAHVISVESSKIVALEILLVDMEQLHIVVVEAVKEILKFWRHAQIKEQQEEVLLEEDDCVSAVLEPSTEKGYNHARVQEDFVIKEEF
jgi:hypothetical protein